MSSLVSIATTVEQMKNMVLALRLGLADPHASVEQASQELLGQLDGVLGQLALLVRPGEPPPSEQAAPLARGTCCDLVTVLQQQRERHRRLLEPELRFEQHIEVSAAAVAVPAPRLERIALELLLRARELTPEGGTVRLRIETRDMFARVVVQAGDPAAAPSEAGLELLAFWWRVIGPGNLTLQARPGQGTSFVLTLPLLLGA